MGTFQIVNAFFLNIHFRNVVFSRCASILMLVEIPCDICEVGRKEEMVLWSFWKWLSPVLGRKVKLIIDLTQAFYVFHFLSQNRNLGGYNEQ